MNEQGKPGRPTLYTPEIADEICRRMAGGESLREVCRDEHMPAESTVRLWNVEDREGFSAQYAKARQALLEYWAEDIVEISDDGSNDWMERKGADGQSLGWTLNGEHVQRSRLRVDSRKWLLSKLVPKYGDKQTLEHTGKDGGPIETRTHLDLSGLSIEQLKQLRGIAGALGGGAGEPERD